MATFIDIVVRAKNEFSNTFRTLTGDLANAHRTLKATGKAIEQTGYNTMQVGSAMTKGITVPIVGLGAASIKAASDFDTAFVGVQKTSDATESEFAKLKKGIRDMSKELPASAVEIANVAEAAGQLGIEVPNLLSFSRTMVDLGETTNLSAEEAASSLAQFANVTGMAQTDFDRLGSVIVDLGNNFATTERDIVEMGQRLAGTGAQIGLSEAHIMALATSMASVGINAEAGGSSFSRVMQKINSEVLSGGDNLSGFARVAGRSAGDFAKVWKEKPQQAITEFVKGLQKISESGADTTTALKDLGISSSQEIDTLLRLSGAADGMSDAFGTAETAWKNNTALSEEARQKYESFAAQVNIAKNKLIDIGITIGEKLMPYVQQGIDYIGKLTEKFEELSPEQLDLIISSLIKLAALGPVIWGVGRATKFLGDGIMAVSGIAKKLKGVDSLKGAFGAILGPGGKVVLILLAIAAAAFFIIKNWDAIKTKAEELFPGIGQKVQDLQTKFGEAMTWISEKFGPVFEKLREFGALLFEFFVTVAGAILMEFITNFAAFVEEWGWLFQAGFEFISVIVTLILDLFTGIITFLVGVFTGDWAKAWEGVVQIFDGILRGIIGIAETVINTVIGIINRGIEAINSIQIPDWVPGLGGASANISYIQEVSMGTNAAGNYTLGTNWEGTNHWRGGLTYIHEKGGEIIDLPTGSRIYPHDESVAIAKKEGQQTGSGKAVNINIEKLAESITVKDERDIKKIAKEVVAEIVKKFDNTTPEPKYT